MKRDRNTQKGATLIELAIAATVLIILGVAAAGLIARFTQATASSTEVSELEEGRSVAADVERTDFDGAGRNLTRSEPPGSGTETWLISNDSDYTSPSPGVIARPSANASLPFKSARRGFGSGTGAIRYTPDAGTNTCHVELTGSDNSYRRISLSNSHIYIYENNQLAASSTSLLGARTFRRTRQATLTASHSKTRRPAGRSATTVPAPPSRRCSTRARAA